MSEAGSIHVYVISDLFLGSFTYTFLDPSAGMLFDTMAHNSKDNSYLAVYDIERSAAYTNECWGLIYK